jgi:hypothetical protein
MGYADDLALMARSLQNLINLLITLEKEAANVGLKINEDKTKYLIVSRNPRTTHLSQNLTVDAYNFEGVSQFKYLGSLLTGENDATPAVKERIAAANRCLFGLHKVLRSNYISANKKVQIYKTVLRPVLIYGLESCTLTEEDENLLEVFERKVLRKIYGGIQENEQWRALYNDELMNLYRNPSITSYLRAQRLLWIGHVQRMDINERIPKKSFESNPDGTRPRGRPKARFKDLIEKDLKKFKISNWKVAASDTKRWKNKVWEAYNQQMYSAKQ